MSHTTRSAFATALTWCVLINPTATAQQPAVPPQAAPQPAVQQPAAQAGVQPAPLQPPPGFQLNALQQAALNQVLDTWKHHSGQITTFKCSFERLEYDVAFGPARDIPLNKNKGELSFGKPDKGSFRITEVKTWQATPVPPGGPPPAQIQGNWVVQPNAVGEHWVCDGKSIFEYRHDNKQLVETADSATVARPGDCRWPDAVSVRCRAAKTQITLLASPGTTGQSRIKSGSRRCRCIKPKRLISNRST